jgi:hypothetical protein
VVASANLAPVTGIRRVSRSTLAGESSDAMSVTTGPAAMAACRDRAAADRFPFKVPAACYTNVKGAGTNAGAPD